MGFGQGLSGLNAAAQNLDVIGNNIANSGTVGFKSGSATLADVYASSRVGLGTKVSGITQRFTVGTINGGGANMTSPSTAPRACSASPIPAAGDVHPQRRIPGRQE